MSERLPVPPTSPETPAEDSLVFDDTDFVYDGTISGIDDEGNWADWDDELWGTTTESQIDHNKFGDKPVLFAEYAVSGIRPEDLAEEPEERELYGEWLNSLDENTNLIIEERKRAGNRYTTIQEEIAKTAPFLLEGKLSPEQVQKLGAEKYVLGVNQSGTSSVEDALNYLKEENGIGLGMYGLDQRFLLIDDKSTAEIPYYTERAIVGGYYQSPNIGRFIIAVPMDANASYTAPQDAVGVADEMPGFMQPTSPDGGRSVSPRYIAGFIDASGIYHQNRNFGLSNEAVFS